MQGMVHCAARKIILPFTSTKVETLIDTVFARFCKERNTNLLNVLPFERVTTLKLTMTWFIRFVLRIHAAVLCTCSCVKQTQ